MTTDLTTHTNGLIAQRYEDEEEGSLGLTADEVRPPYVRYNARDGQFLFTLDGELSNSMRLSILRKLPDSRLRFNPATDDPEKVLCRSVDMAYPVDVAQAAAIGAGPTCAECRFAQFGTDKYGAPTKPGCSQILNLAVATDDDPPIPAFFSVKSTGLKPVRAILSQLEILARTTKQPAYARVVEFAAGAAVKEAAKAYIPLTAKVITEPVPAERREALRELWKLMRDRGDLFDAETAIGHDDEAPADDGLRVMDGAALMRQLDEDAVNLAEPEIVESTAAEMDFGDAAPAQHADPADGRHPKARAGR